jgi:hypothetical protein
MPRRPNKRPLSPLTLFRFKLALTAHPYVFAWDGGTLCAGFDSAAVPGPAANVLRSSRGRAAVSKGRRYAADCNILRAYGKTVFQALELAERTDRAHPLPYVGGLREMENYPPDTFTWFYDGSGKAKEGMGVRDNRTGLVAVWPHLRGSVNTSSDPPGCPAVPQAKCS